MNEKDGEFVADMILTGIEEVATPLHERIKKLEDARSEKAAGIFDPADLIRRIGQLEQRQRKLEERQG